MSGVKETYTTTDLTVILQISQQALSRRATKEQWLTPVTRHGRGGVYTYSYATLPSDIKAAIARHEAEKAPKHVQGNAIIPDWSHRIGLARYQVVAAWRTTCSKAKGSKVEITAAFLVAYNSGQINKDVFEIIGEVQKSSLYRWDKLLKENGDDYYALCDQRGKWNKGGKKGLGQLTREAQEAFLSIWLTPNQPSVKLAYDGMKIALRKIGQDVPSLSSTYRFAERFQESFNDLVILKREGEKALNDKVSGWIPRNPDLLKVGDCLFADGHTLNFECLHPETGKPFRPTLIVWFDWRSAMPVGWEVMPTENIISISSALFMAINNLGKYPKVPYLDNGRAFKGKYFTETNPDFESLNGLYGRLGMALHLAKPYHGQTKVVERFFRTFNEQCGRLMPSYCGANIYDKPAWRQRNEKYHKALHDKRAWVPSLREALQIFQAYVEWYGTQPHPRNKEVSHWDIFKEGCGPGVDTADLARQFLWTKKVRPYRTKFTLAGLQYESDNLYGLNKDIIVKFSWADLSEVYLYDLEGHSLGKARPQIELHPLAKVFGDEHDQAMVADANRRLNSMKKGTLQAARSLDKGMTAAPGLTALPYVPTRKEPVPQLPAPGQTEEALSAEQKAELEEIARIAIEQHENNRFIKPAYFATELDRYEWLFSSMINGYQPDAEEAAFMVSYEASNEYKVSTGARYEQMKEVFGLIHNGGVQ